MGGENIKSESLLDGVHYFVIGTFSLACFCSRVSLQKKKKRIKVLIFYGTLKIDL